jgi:uncharacterized membrane protein YphA (DoxX/SURF4 family)
MKRAARNGNGVKSYETLNFYPAVNGGDAAILFCFAFLYIAFAGPGVLSLDSLRERFSAEKRLSTA